MALYLVGENIDKARSHYQASTGKIIQLRRGIYVDSTDEIEEIIFHYAIRIAKYLYPRSYLSASTSIQLHPTADGKLFISGTRRHRTRIRNLEIIQNQSPPYPSVSTAIIKDDWGEFKVEVSSIRLRFLEAFRLRSEHASSLDEAMRRTMAKRLIEEFGTSDKAADAIWSLSRQNEWYREGELAERYLKKGVEFRSFKNAAELNFIVAWHGEPMGNLIHDGVEWRWASKKNKNIPLIRQTIPGKLPPFINSLLPEGWLKSILKDEDERATLRSGKRYMSNIFITNNEKDIPNFIPDILETPLHLFSKNGLFTGKYAGLRPNEIHQSFDRNLANIYQESNTPRLSGIQMKAPMYLSPDGILLATANSQPFTHILKPAGKGGFEFLPIIEWLSLELGRKIGFDVPKFALVLMPDNMPPALLIERFDICSSINDSQRIALEDFCSLLDFSSDDKYKGTIEQAARALKSISTSPTEDLNILVKRALFAWLIADGDMHLKNMALLKIAEPKKNVFHSVRMSPLYDAVTTIVFPGLKNDRMALKMNGKDSRLKQTDFMRLSATIGLKASEALSIINNTVLNLQEAVKNIKIPQEIECEKSCQIIISEMLHICKKRLIEFTDTKPTDNI